MNDINGLPLRGVLSKRIGYKPFQYPEYYQRYLDHYNVNWRPEETRLDDDIHDWNSVLTDQERSFLTEILRFFTEADVSVAEAYRKAYLPMFDLPEVSMMVLGFAEREPLHIRAYSYLIDTIGLPSSIYKAFMEYEEMAEKHAYTDSFLEGTTGKVDVRKLLKQIACFSAFTEGMQLFSSFIMLLNFSRFGKMKGMGEIVRWSIRDENMHCEGMSQIFKDILREYPEYNTQELEDEIREIGKRSVELEDKFIDLCFSHFGDALNQGLSREETKQYIRYIADRRMIGIGYKGIFNVRDNPIPWVDEILAISGHGNFFEVRVIDYSRGSHEGSWSKDFWKNNVDGSVAQVTE